MFSTIKIKLMFVLSALLAVAVTTIKILLLRNEIKDEKINILKENIEVNEQIHEEDIKRVKFEVKQKQKVKAVNDESNLNNLDKKRGVIDEKNKDSLFESVNR